MSYSSFRRKNRKGVVIFVVMGSIFVLAILVMSYNYLVRGKFNESKEILKHLVISRCAKSTCEYIFAYLQNDLENINSGNNSLKEIFLKPKTGSDLYDSFTKNWLNDKGDEIGRFAFDILEGNIAKGVEPNVNVIVDFSDIKLLKELKTNEPDLFIDNEKVGRLTIRVEITVEHSREIWQETRPFKVVCPFPVPVTKFSFYWNDGAKDPYGFNTVSIDDDGNPTNRTPFRFINGDDGETKGDLWLNRGWIYIGGDNDLFLNRASGDKKYGQRFFTYKYPQENPSTLMMTFPNDIDGWESQEYKGERLGFRTAYWGFSDTLTDSANNESWAKILRSEYNEHPLSDANSKKYWQSSCLHLFSIKEVEHNDGNENVVPSITRVTGKVYDRFLEMGYLLPRNSSDVFFAAIINLNKEEFDEERRTLMTILQENPGFVKYNFDKYLFVPDGFPMENSEKDILQEYFSSIKYINTENPNGVAYKTVMSKVVEDQFIDVTYDVVHQYCNNTSNNSLPPEKSSVPRINDLKFWPSNEKPYDDFPENAKSMQIKDIGSVEDKTLGLNLRKCYKLKGSSEKIIGFLDTNFGSNKEGGFGWNLNNLVYEVESEGDSGEIDLGIIKRINSPGSIYCNNGSLKVDSYSETYYNEKSLLLLSANGAISINNSEKSIVPAYLVALGENGTVKKLNDDAALNIKGGMAVKDFTLESIPKKGGYLEYNTQLDPTKETFKECIGVALGPRGGRL